MTIRDWLSFPAEQVTLAIVFTDIVGSTALQAEVGDYKYQNEIRPAHFARARNLISIWGGHQVKTSGDSFYVVFRTAIDALNFAEELHNDTGHELVQIRSGIHVGAVRIADEGDVHGSAVNYINRVMDAAKNPVRVTEGIVLSRDAKSQIEFEKAPRHQNMWFVAFEKELQGFSGKQQLYRVMSPTIRTTLVKHMQRKRRAAASTTPTRGDASQPTPPQPSSDQTSGLIRPRPRIIQPRTEQQEKDQAMPGLRRLPRYHLPSKDDDKK